MSHRHNYVEPLVEGSASKNRSRFAVFDSGESLKHSKLSPIEKFTKSALKDSKRTIMVGMESSRREKYTEPAPGLNTTRRTDELMNPLTERNFQTKTSTESKKHESQIPQISVSLIQKTAESHPQIGSKILDKFLFKSSPQARDDFNDHTKETFYSRSRSRSGSKTVKIQDAREQAKPTKFYQNLQASNVQASGSKTQG